MVTHPCTHGILSFLAQFFMAPSLTTGKGKLKMGRGFSQYRYRTGLPIAVLELR